MRTSVVVAFLALAGAAGGVWYMQVGRGVEVTTVSPTRGNAAEVVYATGVVEPQRWAKVISLQRKRIVDLCDCEGKPVKAGDVLAKLDDYEERAALAEMEARRNRIDLDTQRIKGLLERNAATQTAYDQSMTQLQEFEARIAAQKDRIADLQLRAPMDGVVLRRDGEIGEIAGTGANDVLFWVGQPKPLRVLADVNEEDIPRVQSGQKVLLRSEGFKDATLDARVGDITPKGDPATKTFRVYLNLPESTPLRIGMSVEANIVTREKPDALLVPAEAMIDNAVFVLNGETLRRVPIRMGIRGSRMIEIASGVSETDRIVSPARSDLRDGGRARLAGAK
jgi:membrane fusion protein (multidrug efflux system)